MGKLESHGRSQTCGACKHCSGDGHESSLPSQQTYPGQSCRRQQTGPLACSLGGEKLHEAAGDSSMQTPGHIYQAGWSPGDIGSRGSRLQEVPDPSHLGDYLSWIA